MNECHSTGLLVMPIFGFDTFSISVTVGLLLSGRSANMVTFGGITLSLVICGDESRSLFWEQEEIKNSTELKSTD